MSKKTPAEVAWLFSKVFALTLSVWKKVTVLSSTPATFVTLELLLLLRQFSSKSQRAIWCRLLHLKLLIFKEKSLMRWEPAKQTKHYLLVRTIFLVQMPKTIQEFWLSCSFLQHKHEIDHFSWWLSKIEPVAESLKYSSCWFSPCFSSHFLRCNFHFECI